jgi:hypothetical protein
MGLPRGMHLEPHATIFLLEGIFYCITGVLKKLWVREDVIELEWQCRGF